MKKIFFYGGLSLIRFFLIFFETKKKPRLFTVALVLFLFHFNFLKINAIADLS